MALKVESLTPLLQVFDMPRSIAFYRDVLGFEVVETSQPRNGDDFDWGMLRLGDMILMLNTAYEKDNRPPEPDPARVAAHDDTALFFGCRDLDAVYAHLRAHGIDAQEPKVAPYGMKQVWLKDPDGYVICFQWPAQGEKIP
ncbi:MAG TPA: VOC family protein [Thermoanaerobaculia bacterium]|nr:VOC family protein [Thermoanaerobaculia bacterium]